MNSNNNRELSFAKSRFRKLLLVIHPQQPMLTSMSFTSWYRRWRSSVPHGSTSQATQAAAVQGDADAQFALGLKYSTENSAAHDPEQAAHWYGKAAEQHHLLAQFNLAIMLAGGQGVPRNDAAALTWTRRAAEGGDAGAQHALGMRCHRSSVDRQQIDSIESRIEAYKWFNLAAAQGYQGSASARERVTLDMTRDEVTDGNQRAAAFTVNRPGQPLAPASSTHSE